MNERQDRTPVKLKHCGDGHPAVVQLQLLLQELVSRQVVVSKVILWSGNHQSVGIIPIQHELMVDTAKQYRNNI